MSHGRGEGCPWMFSSITRLLLGDRCPRRHEPRLRHDTVSSCCSLKQRPESKVVCSRYYCRVSEFSFGFATNSYRLPNGGGKSGCIHNYCSVQRRGLIGGLSVRLPVYLSDCLSFCLPVPSFASSWESVDNFNRVDLHRMPNYKGGVAAALGINPKCAYPT